jgi:hypothetical protein
MYIAIEIAKKIVKDHEKSVALLREKHSIPDSMIAHLKPDLFQSDKDYYSLIRGGVG